MRHDLFVLFFEEKGARMGVKAIGEFHAWVNPNIPLFEILTQLRAAVKTLEGGSLLSKEGQVNGSDISNK